MHTITNNEAPVSELTNLANLIRVRQRFLRSVNLVRDFYLDDPLHGYIPTESSIKAFERIAPGITDGKARAFTITGPYGTGKSAFALFAAKALAASGGGGHPLRKRIVGRALNISNKLFGDEAEGFWPVLVVGGREPIGNALVRGLLAALEQLPYSAAAEVRQRLIRSSDQVIGGESLTAHEVTLIFSEAAALARQHDPNCRGLLLVIDELGKFLEYAATYPARSDMQVLQELAEFAVRSGDTPVLLVTILHQAFEDYAHRLSALQRNEWQKVQGRFSDISYGDGPDVLLLLVAEAVEASRSPLLEDVIQRRLADDLTTCERLKLFPERLTSTEFREVLAKTYPLHPLALLVLPHLFRRFGQNERSLFAFLSGDDPFGFQEFLRTHALGGLHEPVLRVEHLYDYVIATMGSAVYSHATAKLWSETEEALFRVRDRDPLQARLVKVIGLLSILGEQTKILPRKDVLVFALAGNGVTKEQVTAAIAALETATLITFRQFKQAYRLYEGSDIDVDARLKEARTHFSHGADAIKTATAFGPNPPVVARRHSYQTGTLRYFDVRYCRAPDLEREILAGPNQGHGLLLLCLTSDEQEMNRARTTLRKVLPDHPHVIVGLNVETEALHEAVVALETLRWVQDQTPELRNDRVAAREVRERLVDALTTFQAEWERLLRPQPGMDGGIWFHGNDVEPLSSYRKLQEWVSQACDDAYDKTPRLHNELINRRQISSSAAAGRRTLIEAMIRRRHEFRLGIEGHPPELSMYASILKETGIHRLGDGAVWGFYPPTTDANLLEVWNAVEEFLFAEGSNDKSVTRLNELLRGRPYGIADGVIPVLLCAVLLHNEAEVAVYEDERFVTELDSATFERMIKRPADFQLKGCAIEGERRIVLERFARGLLSPDEKPTVVSVVRELFRQFRRLPEYAWKTRRLSPQALALRDLFNNAREPEQLLFVELPQALGAKTFSADGDDGDNAAEFFQRWNDGAREVLGAYGALIDRAEQELLKQFSLTSWEEVKARSAALLGFVSEPPLKAFVLRAGDYKMQRGQWLESTAAVVAGKPPSFWVDADEDRFLNALPPIVSAFRHAELVAFEKKKAPTANRVGMRIAITLESGAEDARVVLVPTSETARVEVLTASLLDTIRQMLNSEPDDIRVAVIGQVAQAIIRGEHE